MMLTKVSQSILRRFGFAFVRFYSPERRFHSNHYLQYTARRLEHLASLNIPVAGTTVLEVGAGIGDLSHYYLDRGCRIVITDARQENLSYLRERYPGTDIQLLDLENPHPLAAGPFDIVHCYGLLYHVKNPQQALQFLSHMCKHLLLLETCVSFEEDRSLTLIAEKQESPTQAFSGVGCRPSRAWVYAQLKEQFAYVYIPKTQPNHEEFPVDWMAPEKYHGLSRAIFVASRSQLRNPLLTAELLSCQTRHA